MTKHEAYQQVFGLKKQWNLSNHHLCVYVVVVVCTNLNTILLKRLEENVTEQKLNNVV